MLAQMEQYGNLVRVGRFPAPIRIGGITAAPTSLKNLISDNVGPPSAVSSRHRTSASAGGGIVLRPPRLQYRLSVVGIDSHKAGFGTTLAGSATLPILDWSSRDVVIEIYLKRPLTSNGVWVKYSSCWLTRHTQHQDSRGTGNPCDLLPQQIPEMRPTSQGRFWVVTRELATRKCPVKLALRNRFPSRTAFIAGTSSPAASDLMT
jgi:hypothetical protein